MGKKWITWVKLYNCWNSGTIGTIDHILVSLIGRSGVLLKVVSGEKLSVSMV